MIAAHPAVGRSRVATWAQSRRACVATHAMGVRRGCM